MPGRGEREEELRGSPRRVAWKRLAPGKHRLPASVTQQTLSASVLDDEAAGVVDASDPEVLARPAHVFVVSAW